MILCMLCIFSNVVYRSKNRNPISSKILYKTCFVHTGKFRRLTNGESLLLKELQCSHGFHLRYEFFGLYAERKQYFFRNLYANPYHLLHLDSPAFCSIIISVR